MAEGVEIRKMIIGIKGAAAQSRVTSAIQTSLKCRFFLKIRVVFSFPVDTYPFYHGGILVRWP